MRRNRRDRSGNGAGSVSRLRFPNTLPALGPATYASRMKRINCVCGLVVEGDDDDELWENAQQHMRDDHPDLVGKVLRDDIVAQAEETGSTRSS